MTTPAEAAPEVNPSVAPEAPIPADQPAAVPQPEPQPQVQPAAVQQAVPSGLEPLTAAEIEELRNIKEILIKYRGPQLKIVIYGLYGHGKTSYIRSCLHALGLGDDLPAVPVPAPCSSVEGGHTMYYREFRVAPESNVIICDVTGFRNTRAESTEKVFRSVLSGDFLSGDEVDYDKPPPSRRKKLARYELPVQAIMLTMQLRNPEARDQFSTELPAVFSEFSEVLMKADFAYTITGVVTFADEAVPENELEEFLASMKRDAVADPYLVTNYVLRKEPRCDRKDLNILRPLFAAFKTAQVREAENVAMRNRAEAQKRKLGRNIMKKYETGEELTPQESQHLDDYLAECQEDEIALEIKHDILESQKLQARSVADEDCTITKSRDDFREQLRGLANKLSHERAEKERREAQERAERERKEREQREREQAILDGEESARRDSEEFERLSKRLAELKTKPKKEGGNGTPQRTEARKPDKEASERKRANKGNPSDNDDFVSLGSSEE